MMDFESEWKEFKDRAVAEMKERDAQLKAAESNMNAELGVLREISKKLDALEAMCTKLETISNQLGVQQDILEGISYLSSLLGVWTQGIANAIDPQIEKQRVKRENARDARNRRARNASK